MSPLAGHEERCPLKAAPSSSWIGSDRVALRVDAAIEDADCVGLQFDNELLNHVIDGLLADRDFGNSAVVFAES